MKKELLNKIMLKYSYIKELEWLYKKYIITKEKKNKLRYKQLL